MPTIIQMPTLSSTMERGKVVKWCVQEGAQVKEGEILFEVETDKANVEVESTATGFLRKILIGVGTEVPVQTALAVVAETMEEDVAAVPEVASAKVSTPEPEEDAPVAAAKVAAPQTGGRIKISPLARRIARERGIDITKLTGSGPGGRIIKQDVEKAAAGVAGPPSAAPARDVVREAPPVDDGFEEIEFTKMRQVIAERLSESKRTAPHFYIDMSADATAISQLKEDLAKKSEQVGIKVTINDILIKLVSQALKEFPRVNAALINERIRVFKAVNVGVAVGIEEGLIVPVVKNADRKTISEIGREVRDLAERARTKKLLPDEYSGGTFTISNLGMFGVETFHAILNPPESGILAVSAAIPKPVAVDGEIVIRPCMKLSLSVDHRLVDGVLAAKFLRRVKELVEAPFLMFV
jgi:pyruvate dehydrogenase E2 component (dihydrolipoamide acetyltransferase)